MQTAIHLYTGHIVEVCSTAHMANLGNGDPDQLCVYVRNMEYPYEYDLYGVAGLSALSETALELLEYRDGY